MKGKNLNPSVSIILPTYNRGYIIENAIQSVLNQTYKNWELIIIDDGSVDNTYDIISKYLDNPKIIYYKQANKKQASAKNLGLFLSKGDYIAFLDSDDEYLPNHIAKRVEYFQKYPFFDIIYGEAIIIGDPFVPDKYNPNKLIHLSECYIGGTFFGKKEAFLKLKGFNDLPYGEDSDLMERAIRANLNIEKVDFKTYIYNRFSEDSICRISFNENKFQVLRR